MCVCLPITSYMSRVSVRIVNVNSRLDPVEKEDDTTHSIKNEKKMNRIAAIKILTYMQCTFLSLMLGHRSLCHASFFY